MPLCLQAIFKRLDLHALLTDFALHVSRFIGAPFIPFVDKLALHPLLTLLFQLLGKPGQLRLATEIQASQLKISDDVVNPFRVQQQVFQMVELFAERVRWAPSCSLTRSCSRYFSLRSSANSFFSFRAIPIEIEELFALLLILSRFLVGTAEYCGQTRHCRALFYII